MNIFGNATANVVNTSARALPGTAQLVAVAATHADYIITALDDEKYASRVETSATNTKAMDELVSELINVSLSEVEFLNELSEETLMCMIRSQQSKRSRLKGKQMTDAIYTQLLNAAVAEYLLRMAAGKPKSSRSARRHDGAIGYSAEELEALAANQEALGKAIRNVQSKKSIAKAKADFSEESERWQELLELEAQLKSLRVSNATRVVEVDQCREAVLNVFENVAYEDIEQLDADAAREMLQRIYAACTSTEKVEAE